MALLDDIRKSEYLSLLGDKLQGLLDVPTSAARFLVNPTAFVDATTGKTAMPKEVGFAEGASGLPQRENLTVLDPRNRAYMEGYQTGEPFSYAAMASPMVGAGATKLSDKLVQAITGNPMATGSKVIDYASAYNPSQIFIGASAKNFDKKAAFEASKMEKAGKTAEEIWQKTGTVRGLDNNWRQEISDKDIPVLSYGTAKELASYPQMQNVLGHKELYKNYGGILSNAPVGADEAVFTRDFMGKPKVGGASFNQRTNEYTVSPRPEGATGSEYAKEQKSALIHELQHGVQKIEDWNRGGHFNYFNQQDDALLAKKVLMMRDEIDRLPSSIPFEDRAKTVKEMFEKLDMSPIDKKTMEIVSDVGGQPNNELQNLVTLYGLDKRSTPYSPFEMYNNLAGEAEARLAQTRIDLTPEQRLENFPFKQGKFGLDINPDDALIWNEGADLLRRKSLLNQGLLD
jgi:hypothetical protein